MRGDSRFNPVGPTRSATGDLTSSANTFPEVVGLSRLLAQERHKTTGERGSFVA